MRLPLKSFEEFGAARGIYQGEDPPANTVYDSYNIDTVDGRWKTRPGFLELVYAYSSSVTPTLWGTIARGLLFLGEYIPDGRYDSSHFGALIALGSSLTSNEIYSRSIPNLETINALTTPAAIGFTGSKHNKFRSVMSLIRRVKSNGDSEYTPGLIITNGIEPPMVYHQFDNQENLDVLEAIDPGFSDATTLAEVPRGKFIAVFREKVFMANTKDAANRVWSSTPELGGAFTANSWLSSYNFDVGHGERITGLLPYRDTMLIFTDQKVYSISGAGVDSDWDLRVVDDEHGAIEDCYTICNGQVYFANKDGMFILGKGNISHPALVDTWSKISWSDDRGGVFMVSDENRVIMVAANVPCETAHAADSVVFDTKNKAFSKWETSSSTSRALLGIRVASFGGMEGSLVFGTPTHLAVLRGKIDTWRRTGSTLASAPNAMITSQDRLAKSPSHKTLRQIVFSHGSDYDASANIVGLVDGESYFDAVSRSANGYINCIEDAVSTTTHDVKSGVGEFSTGDVVDVLLSYYPNVAHDDLTLGAQPAPSAGQIEFPLAFSAFSHVTILAENNPIREMSISATAPLSSSPISLSGIRQSRTVMAYNAGGRSFGFSAYFTGIIDIEGWGFWYRETGRVRP